jgi:hypothetical protein
MNDSPTSAPDIFKQSPVTGAAYHPIFKGMATVLMMALAFYAWRFFESAGTSVSRDMKWMFATTGLMVLFSYYALLRSTTTLSANGIEQSWMFKKPITWDEIRSVRVVRMPAAVRLIIRTQTGRFVIFHAGTSALAEAFAVVANRYSR